LVAKEILTFMPNVKWTTFSEINPEREYFAFANVGERKSVWSYFSLLMGAQKVAKQLEATKGAIGITGRLGFLNKKLVVVGVFENEAALNEFAHSGQHASCMEKTKSKLKTLKCVKWTVLGSKLPPRIEDAINRAKAT
jgi:hypothetical protein